MDVDKDRSVKINLLPIIEGILQPLVQVTFGGRVKFLLPRVTDLEDDPIEIIVTKTDNNFLAIYAQIRTDGDYDLISDPLIKG